MKKLFKRIYSFLLRRDDPAYCWTIREKALSSRKPFCYFYRHKWQKILRRSNSFIPLSATFFGCPVFPHGFHGTFISSGATIGKGCTIFHQVTIGSNLLPDTKNPGAPTIGKNVYIGAGAKIIGGIHIGDNVRIGANCVVVENIPDNCTVVLPSPRIITHDTVRDNQFVVWENKP